MSCIVDGWTVSPRKSRKKSACFSMTTTSMPARASKKPSIIPAGPPPAIAQRVPIGSDIRRLRRNVSMGNRAAASRTKRGENPVSQPPFVRRLRRRRGRALSGEARGDLILVSDVAGATRGPGARQHAGRRGPARPDVDDVSKIAKDHDLVIMHTSTPSLPNDVECARRVKAQNPRQGRFHRRARRGAARADAGENPVIDSSAATNSTNVPRARRKAGRGTKSSASRIATPTASSRQRRTADDPRLGCDAERAADVRQVLDVRSTTTATCCTRTSRGIPAAVASPSARSVSGRKRSAATVLP